MVTKRIAGRLAALGLAVGNCWSGSLGEANQFENNHICIRSLKFEYIYIYLYTFRINVIYKFKTSVLRSLSSMVLSAHFASPLSGPVTLYPVPGHS